MLLFKKPVLLCALFSFAACEYALGSPTAVSESTTTEAVHARATTKSAPATSSTGIYFITTEHITIAGHTDAYATVQPQTINIDIPTCIQTIAPDKNGFVPPGTCHAFYDYYPSFAAALVAAILFGIVTVAHISQATIYKKV